MCQPGSLAVRKWRENEKMNRKWNGNEEMERYLLSTFPHFLFISSLSIHFLSKILLQNVKYGTFVDNVTKKHMRYEKIILGRIHCEKAP